MAGSISVVSSKVPGSGGIRKYAVTWTSDASGNVSGNTVTLGAGAIVLVDFTPGTGGVQPSDLYDVTLTDAEGVNVFDDGSGSASIGANLSQTTGSKRVPFVGGGSVTYVRQWLPGGDYTPLVTNAGNAKQGTITIYQAPGVIT